MKEKLYDISEVCRHFNTTSRTLRFYEAKGLITSSTDKYTQRRKYTAEQVECIRKILVLRALGLPVVKIIKIQSDGTSLQEIILQHKAVIGATINSKLHEIRLLDEALAVLEKGGDIYNKTERSRTQCSDVLKTAEVLTENFIKGEYEPIFNKFSEKMKEYTPLPVLKTVCEDTLKPLGSFVSIEKSQCDKDFSNIVYSYLKYENLGLRIKYVFHNGSIDGFWLNYYEV